MTCMNNIHGDDDPDDEVVRDCNTDHSYIDCPTVKWFPYAMEPSLKRSSMIVENRITIQ